MSIIFFAFVMLYVEVKWYHANAVHTVCIPLNFILKKASPYRVIKVLCSNVLQIVYLSLYLKNSIHINIISRFRSDFDFIYVRSKIVSFVNITRRKFNVFNWISMQTVGIFVFIGTYNRFSSSSSVYINVVWLIETSILSFDVGLWIVRFCCTNNFCNHFISFWADEKHPLKCILRRSISCFMRNAYKSKM